MKVPFGDLKRELAECGQQIKVAIDEVVESGWFVLGERVERFEAQFADYVGEGYATGVGSGTEAIHLALMSAGVEHGDFVVTVPNTAVPTVSAITAAGATPLLVDVDQHSLTMDPSALRDLVSSEKARLGKRLKAIVPVHLYGQSADMDPIVAVAREFDMVVVEDACQAHGATYHGRRTGTLGDYAAFSFYPSKNLGCYGDGGAVIAQTEMDTERLKMLRNYGQSKRYYHDIKGVNSRLDEMQAAILSVKLAFLDAWNERRADIARFYDELITSDAIVKPTAMPYGTPAWHLYAVRHPERDRIMSALDERGVGTLIHYPVPIHLQNAYKDLNGKVGDYPVAEAAAASILSLPMYPQLTDKEIAWVAESVNAVS